MSHELSPDGWGGFLQAEVGTGQGQPHDEWQVPKLQPHSSLIHAPPSSQSEFSKSTRLSLCGLKVSVTPRALGYSSKALGQFGRLPVWTQACALSSYLATIQVTSLLHTH